jgi:hypothetical protein
MDAPAAGSCEGGWGPGDLPSACWVGWWRVQMQRERSEQPNALGARRYAYLLVGSRWLVQLWRCCCCWEAAELGGGLALHVMVVGSPRM